MSHIKEKVVVFGGSGFLGSHVADLLSERGYDVYIYDIVTSPYLKDNQHMIVGDIIDEKGVAGVIKDASFVYNFSGIADIEECSGHALKVMQSNVIGHTQILTQCMIQKVKRIVFASSIYVYGRHGSFYRISKQTCEHLTEEFFERYQLNFSILRYGSLYGPRAQAWNGVQRYVNQAVKEGRIIYPGSGEVKREYIHVYDAARLSIDILDKQYTNECIVITGNYILSAKELILMINEILNSNLKIEYQNETVQHHYNITPHSFIPKIGKKVTPNPYVDMGEGILRLIESVYNDVQNNLPKEAHL